METYRLNEAPALIEALLLDMSRNYIQLVRDKMATGTDEEKETVLYAAFTTYLEAMKLFAPIAPLFVEQVYQDLRAPFSLAEESIHLCPWPEYDDKLVHDGLERDFVAVFDVIGAVLAARDAAGLGVRWPAPELVIETKDDVKAACERLLDLLKQQVNVKNVTFTRFTQAPFAVEPNYRNISRDFGHATGQAIAFVKEHASRIATLLEQAGDETKISLGGYAFTKDHFTTQRTVPAGWSKGEFAAGIAFLSTQLSPSLEAEGFSREIIRRVQQLRKDAGLQKSDAIELALDAPELAANIKAFEKEIMLRTGASKLHLGPFDVATRPHHADAKIKGKKIVLGLKKL